MAYGVVILECLRTPQLEVWARINGVLSGALPRDNASSVSAMVRDNTAQGLTLESPEAWEGCNSVKTCLNGTSQESIGIYAENRCQWNGC